MKVQELMIGDWVMYNPNVFIEDEYEPTKEHYPFQIQNGEDIDLAIEGCYSPIPLTPEILEKNGFTKSGMFGRTYYLAIEDFEVSVYFANANTQLVIEKRSGTTMINLLNVKNVHELQHALRLCKIDKEIEL